jgi:hypothetical protein
MIGPAALSRDEPVNAWFTTYLRVLDKWLSIRFNGLKTIEDWKAFYAYLAKAVVRKENHYAKIKIANKDIVLPNLTDLFQVCRLLFQAMVKVRIGVADGQHRMCAMIHLLTGWSVTVQAHKIPPKTFNRGAPYGLGTENPDANIIKMSPRSMSEHFNNILKTMANPVTVLTVMATSNNHLHRRPSPADILRCAVGYSKVREVSQAAKKPRLLVDV